MAEKPILFSAPMVRAILDGTKTQTRRVVKPQPQMVTNNRATTWAGDPAVLLRMLNQSGKNCPYGQPGDRLWVRETFAHIYRDNTRPEERRDDDVAYKADHVGLDEYAYGTWKPSIHMPRWASRITLEVTGVRVERLQEISEADALAEGLLSVQSNDLGAEVPYYRSMFEPRDLYRMLWESINGPGSWDANPWVWCVEFRRVQP